MCLSVWVYITCMQEPVEIRREAGFPGTDLRDCCDLPCGAGSSAGAQMLLTTDTSLWPLWLIFLRNWIVRENKSCLWYDIAWVACYLPLTYLFHGEGSRQESTEASDNCVKVPVSSLTSTLFHSDIGCPNTHMPIHLPTVWWIGTPKLWYFSWLV